MPEAKNETMRVLDGEQKVRVTVTLEQTGEVLYDGLTFAGVLAGAEQLEYMADGVQGQVQDFTWGNPLAVGYVWLMLNARMKGRAKLMQDLLWDELRRRGMSEADEKAMRDQLEKERGG